MFHKCLSLFHLLKYYTVVYYIQSKVGIHHKILESNDFKEICTAGYYSTEVLLNKSLNESNFFS